MELLYDMWVLIEVAIEAVSWEVSGMGRHDIACPNEQFLYLQYVLCKELVQCCDVSCIRLSSSYLDSNSVVTW